MTEREKMLAGVIYDYNDPEIQELQTKAFNLCLEIKSLKRDDPRYWEIVKELIPNCNNLFINAPFRFEYGCHTHFGTGCFVNYNFMCLDSAPVIIEDGVLIGPNVSVVTPVHPLLADERRPYAREDGVITDDEYALPIRICKDCWIATNVTICGGVTIGEGTVIGAGSVVTKDIPAGVLAAGNPCKVIRKLTEQDSIKYRLKK